MSISNLIVVTMYSNPLGWKAREHNLHRFINYMRNLGVITHVGIVSKPYDSDIFIREDQYIKVHKFYSEEEIWLKENVINQVIARLDASNSTGVAWIDADVQFANTNWYSDTIRQLNRYDVVQMFSHCQNLSSNYQPIDVIRPGYMYQYKTEGEIRGGVNFWDGKRMSKIKMENNAHPGYAWAARLDSLSKIGMLIDWAIVGTGDFHMVAGLLGGLRKAVEEAGFSDDYIRYCTKWEEQAQRVITKNVSYVQGLLLHHYHGTMDKRKYGSQQLLLKKLDFNPFLDLIKDYQGLYQLHPSRMDIRDAIRNHMASRDEDSSELTREIL